MDDDEAPFDPFFGHFPPRAERGRPCLLPFGCSTRRGSHGRAKGIAVLGICITAYASFQLLVRGPIPGPSLGCPKFALGRPGLPWPELRMIQ
jgi:hypothetical protein